MVVEPCVARPRGTEPGVSADLLTLSGVRCRVVERGALLVIFQLGCSTLLDYLSLCSVIYLLSSKISSISTGIFPGRTFVPIAERAPTPICLPKTLARSVLAPFITWVWW